VEDLEAQLEPLRAQTAAFARSQENRRASPRNAQITAAISGPIRGRGKPGMNWAHGRGGRPAVVR